MMAAWSTARTVPRSRGRPGDPTEGPVTLSSVPSLLTDLLVGELPDGSVTPSDSG